MLMGMRKRITIFVSYARANKRLVTSLLDKYSEQVAASKRYNYVFRRDEDILVGENWHGEIQQALSDCDVGLLLVSPAFLGSQYIERHELPEFVGKKAKPVIPVMLQRVDFEFQDLKGLRRAQIFRLDSPNSRSSKAYGECAGGTRDDFAQELFRQVESRLAKLFRT